MDWLAEKGRALIERGYPIVPVLPATKRPAPITGWQKLRANADMLAQWLNRGWAAHSVGVLTAEFPAIDVDCLDAQINGQLIPAIHNLLGIKAPQRVGKAPKTLLVCRAESPFPKLRSARFKDLDGVEHGIEILAQGQKFTAYGIHAETRRPYQWIDGLGLAETNIEQLPLLNLERARGVIDCFEQLARDRGWQVVNSAANEQLPAEDAFATLRPALGLSLDALQALLNAIDPQPLSYDDWLHVGMALHHETDGNLDGLELFDQWSAQDEARYQGSEDVTVRWKSFTAQQAGRSPVTAATLKKMAATVQRAEITSPKEKDGLLLNMAQLRAKLGPVDWTVEGFVEANSTGSLFGAPGSYKSFLALSLSLSIATGVAWHGHPVTRPGPVIYIAGEGHNGLARRVEAWLIQHEAALVGTDLNAIPFHLSQRAFNFNDASAVVGLRKHILDVLGQPPALVVVDTVARNFGGADENATADMNKFVTHADLGIRHAFQCVLLLVHHTGHAAKDRARGSTVLKGAMDFEFRCEREGPPEARRMALHCTKMKDAPEPAVTYWEGASVNVMPGAMFDDPPGEAITSLVLNPVTEPLSQVPANLPKTTAKVLAWLYQRAQPGDGFSSQELMPEMVREISLSERSLRRHLNALVEAGIVIKAAKSGRDGRKDFILQGSLENPLEEGDF